MPITLERSRPAMGSLFRLLLVGDDVEHLTAVADAAFDEIERVERLLSWRDPRSECARVNREAMGGPVLVDYEFAAILATCERARQATGGYFDIAVGLTNAESETSNFKFQIDSVHRLVRFARPEVRLDFGAFGKGYALDRAATELRRFGVTRALLDGGTSSVLALGCDEHHHPWPVGLRNPFPSRPEQVETCPLELRQLRLADSALSCSATFDSAPSSFPTLHSPIPVQSDLVDPHTNRQLAEQAACAVVARSAAVAEILSTALVCMGKARAAEYTESESNEFLDAADCVVWIDQADDRPQVTVLQNRRDGLLA